MLKYVSGSTGKEMSLCSSQVKGRIKKAEFYNYEWKVDSVRQLIGSKINRFRKDAAEYDLILDFIGNKDERARNANDFFEMIEQDVLLGTSGRLYFKEYYIDCFIVGSKSGERDSRYRMVQKEAHIYAPYPFWMKEEKKSFFSQSTIQADDGLDYPHDFAFDFTSDRTGHEIWLNDHYAPSHFQMLVYGPCVNPRILVNGYPYQVFTTLESSDYLLIDSRKNEVTKHLANGTVTNLYNSRQFYPSIFEKIPGGNLSVDWSGAFGFDITLFMERSEPKW